MGCCASRPESPYPDHQPNSSSRAITSSQPQSQAALPRPSTNNSNRSAHIPRGLTQFSPGRSGPGRSSEPIDPSPSEPLKFPRKWKTRSGEKSWTRKSLDAERRAFFDTRVTGRPEIWGAIRTALEVLWQGGDPEDTDGGLATAHSILSAAEITVPNGDLTKVLYDRFGELYNLPKHIVSDPQNLATPSPPPELEDGGEGSKEEGESDEVDEDEILRRREEKGKAVVNEADLVDVKVRFSDAQPDHTVRVGLDDSVRLVVRQIIEDIALSPPKRIRLNYRGRMLEVSRSLKAQGWNGTDVINGLVFDQ